MPPELSTGPADGGVVAGWRNNRRAGNVLAVLLLVIVALAPLPLGGNRPFLWPAWTLLLSLSALIYASILVRYRLALPLGPGRLLVPGVALGLLCLYLAVQSLPLAGVFGLPDVRLPDGGRVATPALSLAGGATWLMLTRWFGYGMLFLLVAQAASSRSRAVVMMQVLFTVLVFYAVLGIALLTMFGDSLLGLQKSSYAGFATASFVNRNSYATFLAFGLAIGAALLVSALDPAAEAADPGERRTPRVGAAGLLIGGMGLIVAALLASGSRMGLFAAISGAGTVLLLGFARRALPGRRMLAGLLAGFLVMLVLLPLFGTMLLDRVSGIENDAESRLELYRQVLGMISTRPFTGFGGGSFELAFQLFHHPPLSADVVWDKAHSTYLTLVAELGVAFGLLVLAMVGWVAAPSVLLLAHPKAGRRVPLAVTGVVIVGALHSLVDFSLEIQADAYLFVTVLAIGFGYAYSARTER